jgi:hypothetical protein
MAISDLISQQKSLLQDLTDNKTLLSQAKADGDEESVGILKTQLNDIQKNYSSVSERITEAKDSENITDAFRGAISPETFTGTDLASLNSSKFDSGKYKVSGFQYPNDLLSNKSYGGNYAMFFINVSVDSKLAVDSSLKTDFVDDFDQTTRRRGSIVASKLSFDQVRGAATAIGAIKAGGLSLLGGSGAAFKSAVTVGAANAVGYTAVGTQAASGTRAQKRLKTSIALHIPNQLLVRYGVNYGEEDTVDFSIAADTIKALQSDNKLSNIANTGKEAAANIALRGAGAQAGAVSAATGLAANPKKEQVFKGVDFRTFTFEYQFFPRSQDEAQNVKNIIDEFKYHMHPEFKGAGEFLFIYPSEFDIVYYTSGLENKNIHKHTSCVLTEMSVNYTPNGVFNTFFESKTGGGMPTQINVNLTFRELQILNKDLVKEGL